MTTQRTGERRRAMERTLKGFGFPNFDILLNNSHPNWENEYGYAFNYATTIFELNELKQFTQEYRPDLNFVRVPEWEFFHLGKLAWMKTKGMTLCESGEEKLTNLHKLVEKYPEPVASKRVDVKSRKTDKAMEDLEGLLDDAMSKKNNLVQPLTILQENIGLNADTIQKHFTEILNEISDPELKDSFKDTTRLAAVVKLILKDVEKFTSNKTLSRKPRQTRPRKINPTKMVRKLKYLKEFKELNLVSIMPEKIIGSEILWVYNVKTRKLGKYVAKSESGLMLKGSTILEYDETQSTSKKIRKPEETLKTVLDAGKVEQKKIIGSIKAVENKLNGRINKDTILVKVY